MWICQVLLRAFPTQLLDVYSYKVTYKEFFDKKAQHNKKNYSIGYLFMGSRENLQYLSRKRVIVDNDPLPCIYIFRLITLIYAYPSGTCIIARQEEEGNLALTRLMFQAFFNFPCPNFQHISQPPGWAERNCKAVGTASD